MTREERRYWRRETIKAAVALILICVMAWALPNWWA